jgi:hypothetical protein
MKRKKPNPPNPFPMEAIFPGIHKERPDIAQADAEAFLAYGHKQDGFDLDDPCIRAQFLDGPKFITFKVKPHPSIQKLIDGLPEDWEEREDRHAQALAITDAVNALYALRKRGLTAMILEDKELWIERTMERK